MKKNMSVGLIFFTWTSVVFSAGSRVVMVDRLQVRSGSNTPRGTVAYAVEEVEQALLNQQYNRALMLTRALKPQTFGFMLGAENMASSASIPAAESVSTPASTPASVPAPVQPSTPVSAQESPSTGVVAPAPAAVVNPAPSSAVSSSQAITFVAHSAILDASAEPDKVQKPLQFSIESYSDARFAALVQEMRALLIVPIEQIAALWRTKPAECVQRYRVHIVRIAHWSHMYAKFLSSQEWRSLAEKFYKDLIEYTWSGSDGITKPIRITRMGSGIQGRANANIYGILNDQLQVCKESLGSFKNKEISDLQKRVQEAATASWQR